jgi:hypothetical protein
MRAKLTEKAAEAVVHLTRPDWPQLREALTSKIKVNISTALATLRLTEAKQANLDKVCPRYRKMCRDIKQGI